MRHTIVGFHRDDTGEWVADLSCGHGRFVSLEPLFEDATAEDRERHLGALLECRRCDEEQADEGGDPACWAEMVCERCGSLVERPGHVCPTGRGPLQGRG